MSGHKSDALGVAGEAAFRDLCSRAELIVTKTELDRCGWDFRVEWRNASRAIISDSSPPRPAALVQVKAIFQSSSRFSLRLGAANDLVKTLEPSFLVVLVFSRDLNLLQIRCAPTLGPIAPEILRAIRRSTAEGADASNQIKQFGMAKWTNPIARDPHSLERYLAEHMGPDLRDYAASKQEFLKNTGFEEARLSLNAKLFGTPEEVADAFLGDRSILGELVSAFEERFDIPLPLENFQPSTGSFEFSPAPHARLKATFENAITGKRFRFDGYEYRVPAIVAQVFTKIKFEFRFFTLYAFPAPGGRGKLSFSVRSKDLKSARATTSNWLEFYRFLDAVARTKLEIRVRQIGTDNGVLDGTVGPEPKIGNAFQTDRAVGMLTLLNKIARDSGIESVEWSPEDFNNIEQTLDCLVRASGKTGHPYLNLEVDTLADSMTKPRFMLLLTFRLMDQLLTIFVDAKFVEYERGECRDLFKLEKVKYLRSELTNDYFEVETIASALAEKYADRDILMLPQGNVGQTRTS